MIVANRKWTTAPSIYCDGCGGTFEDPEYPAAHIGATCPHCKSKLHCVAAEPVRLFSAEGDEAGKGVKWAWELSPAKVVEP